MYGTHDGLSKMYEVSCSELDFLIDIVRDKKDVLGARMMGGGFGGCTVNLVDENQAESFCDALRRGYRDGMGIEASVYLCRASAGAGPAA